MHIRTLFAFLLALSFVPAESHDVSKTLPYGQICIHGPGYSELADLDSQVMKKVNTTLRVSCPSRLHIKRGLMASPTKCYAAMLFAVAVVDLLSWLVCKLDSRSTSLVSDRYFCLLSWSETKKARQFVGRMVLYSLGNGNFFHFIVNFFIITLIGPRVEGLYGREKITLLLVATVLLGGLAGTLGRENADNGRGSSSVSCSLLTVCLSDGLQKPTVGRLLFFIVFPYALMAISKDSAVSPRAVIHYVGYLCGLVFWVIHTISENK